LPTGKKLSQARWGVIPAAARTAIVATTTTIVIRPATSGPDPGQDREGLDIGFLGWCDRLMVEHGQL
jgi:hypothetical protein